MKPSSTPSMYQIQAYISLLNYKKMQIPLLQSICISSQEYLFTNTASKLTEVIESTFNDVVCASVLKIQRVEYEWEDSVLST